ncbi:unnamed protein product [Clonostachys chloroleuca]|uniref:Uncharacterized protein n=1 Tax=Clonostachys chloroleuca TaxID=1926264 RepID=A0AA35M6J1_9HYPO|nr:unnamed protein product [Clonostachys chloroleuca]
MWDVEEKIFVLLYYNLSTERAIIKVNITEIVESKRSNTGKQYGCKREEYSYEASLEVALQVVVLTLFIPGTRKHTSFAFVYLHKYKGTNAY